MGVLKRDGGRHNLEHYKCVALRETGHVWGIRLQPAIPNNLETPLAQGTEQEMRDLLKLIDAGLAPGLSLIALDLTLEKQETARQGGTATQVGGSKRRKK